MPAPQILKDAFNHILEHPEEWDQGDWMGKGKCGTVGCLAYHIVAQSKGKPNHVEIISFIGESILKEAGLSSDDINFLFSYNRTLSEIRHYIETGETKSFDIYRHWRGRTFDHEGYDRNGIHRDGHKMQPVQ